MALCIITDKSLQERVASHILHWAKNTDYDKYSAVGIIVVAFQI